MTAKLTPEQTNAEKDRIADLRAVMATPAGRRFMWRLIGDCGTFQSGWSPSAEIHLRAGMRQIGLAMFADVHAHCFEQYQEMEREAREAALLRQEREKSNHNNEES